MSAHFDMDVIQRLPWKAVETFLHRRQWKRVSQWGEFAFLYEKEISGRPRRVVVPNNSNLADYSSRMFELLVQLSDYEEVTIEQIVRGLVSTAYDVFRVKATESDEFGSVPLAAGEKLFESGRDVLVAAAAHEASHRPDRVRAGRVPDAAKEYIDRVRLGQTEKGSFVLTLLSPYLYDPIETPQLFDQPFGRRVCERLGRAFAAVTLAISEAPNRGVATFEDGVDAGISSKLCRALSEIALASDGAELSVAWSAEKPSTQEVRLNLDRHSGTLLAEASEYLAVKAAPETTHIEGTITGVMESTNDLEGVVKILARFEGGNRVVQTRFNADQRATIFRAFQEKALFSISLVGELNRATRPWSLDAPRDFELVLFEIR
jgi:hypothetical protein